MSSYTIPNIIAQHPRGERIMDVYSHLLSERIIYLGTAIDSGVANALIAQLLHLEADKPDQPINLYINCEGGDMTAMLAIRDVMRLVPCDVSTLALGLACSAGQFLLSAGTPGKRFALRNARVLMHQGSAGIGGSAVEIEIQANDLRHIRDTVNRLVADDTGQSVESVFDDSLHDRWYTAEEARTYGFIDHIVETFDQVMPRQPAQTGATR